CPIEKPIEAQAAVKDGKEGNVSLTSKDTFLYPIKKGEEQDFCVTVKPTVLLSAPVKTDAVAGEFEITFKNQLLFSGKLYTIKDVPARDYLDHLDDVIDAW
ncbi:MAG: hypothetical protein K2M95_05325, partial [Clostridiales bacterium]|nr:hypothetical protein [Clostridiales bacterium]